MIISYTLFGIGYSYEYTKRKAAITVQIADRQITEWCERYDATHQPQAPCTGNILCERSNTRHKSGCIGREVPIRLYMKEVA